MKTENTIVPCIEKLENQILNLKSDIEKLKEINLIEDKFETSDHLIFISNNNIKSGKLRVLSNWKCHGLVVCDSVTRLNPNYKVYNDCAVLFYITKINTYDPNKRQWITEEKGFINKNCKNYFDLFNRNNKTLREALDKFSKTSLYKNNPDQIPGWLQDFFILF